MELSVILGRPKFIEKLLKMKPDLISYVGHSGHSILALACLWGREESVDALFKGLRIFEKKFSRFILAGADFAKPENEEDEIKPLDLAVQAGHQHLVDLVKELGNFSESGKMINLSQKPKRKQLIIRARKEPKRERNRFTASFIY